MVDRADLQAVNDLYDEYRRIAMACDMYDAGEVKIVAMTVASAGSPVGVTVDTSFIPYPAPMLEAIKNALTARRAAIRSELEGLGLNMEGPDNEWASPAVQQAAAARTRTAPQPSRR